MQTVRVVNFQSSDSEDTPEPAVAHTVYAYTAESDSDEGTLKHNIAGEDNDWLLAPPPAANATTDTGDEDPTIEALVQQTANIIKVQQLENRQRPQPRNQICSNSQVKNATTR